MKIATWNVNGIRARAGQVCEFLEKEQPDVLCLQELKANIDQVPLECRISGYHIYWHGSTTKAYSGAVTAGIWRLPAERRTSRRSAAAGAGR